MDDRNSEGFSTITPEEARAMMDDGDVVILDVREPSEFATGHVPGAINCPVLDDAERAEIGTLYKQARPVEAKKKGAALVARNIGKHLENTLLDKPRDWKPLIYCWRGGNRSGAMAHGKSGRCGTRRKSSWTCILQGATT